MKQLYIIFIFLATNLCGQEIITGTYDFQSDPEKAYALYIPSDYDASIPSKVILGLHPWNTSKWDAESWAQELAEIAEANNCIVICPDGGVDGKVDDDIDTSFTSFLLEEMAMTYNLDQSNIYAVGFSWGAKTVYTYGLNHIDKFAGFMPIGAAIEVSEITAFQQMAKDKPFYIIHGSEDSPNIRFAPLVTLLNDNMACVETNLLQGIGHTVEFPDQFDILNSGLQYLIDVNCNIVDVVEKHNIASIKLVSNSIEVGTVIEFQTEQATEYKLYDSQGRLLLKGKNTHIQQQLSPGIYFIQLGNQSAERILIRN